NHKTYLGEESDYYYTAAKKAAKEVINAYTLCPDYEALFMGDNGENPDARNEIVYASCYDATRTQSYGGATYLIAASQGNLKDGDKKRLGTTEAWSGLVTSTEFVAKLIGQGNADAAEAGAEPTFTSVDKRALVSLRFSDDKTMNGSDFTAGWHVWKFNNNRFLDPETDYSERDKFVSIDFPMIRAAEMYLAYAEAQARIDGGTTSDETAVGYIAELQQRAGVPVASQVLGPVTLENIFDEITRELYWEGFRRTTLIRFDKFTSGSYLWPLKGGVASGQALSDHLKLFPLPADDMQVNDNLVQNPGY
ncbi:MAG: RagB/SusD family nutrient uptake outer membrane protein, partial [Alistipes sp.]|nr:RagB/SusD family nutrient uptake outer membrane protein [Alistipes sp.]